MNRAAQAALLVLVAVGVGTAGCARIFVRPRPEPAAATHAIVAAGAKREERLAGMRLTLSVRATAGPPSARLASPAYLAIDGPDRLRLQVLSPFGVTVLDLTTEGDAFTLTLPLRGETRQGRIDLAALAAGATPEEERMIVALALLFRPKMRPDRCTAAGTSAVSCTIATNLAATITVDAALRPIREEYLGPGGRTVLVSEITDYPDQTRAALPGRITISDGQGGAALVVRVVRAESEGDAGLKAPAMPADVLFSFTRGTAQATVAPPCAGPPRSPSPAFEIAWRSWPAVLPRAAGLPSA